MNETCPGCGAERVGPYDSESEWYACCSARRNGEWWIITHDCLTRTLAQRDERNAALEARIKELEAERVRERDQLRADLVTVVPVVRAAMWYANAEAQRNDAEAVMAMGQIYDCVRALPAAVLERMGVK
jgi:hypothetical protein